MGVPCFTRAERNGMYVIQPLAGRMKHDCLIVNETVYFVYEQLQRGVALDDLVTIFAARALAGGADGNRANGAGGEQPLGTVNHPNTEDERIRFDLYRILLAFRDRDVCDYAFDDLLRLLPAGRRIKGATQVMPVCLLHEVSSAVLRSIEAASVSSNGGSAAGTSGSEFQVFYSFMAAASLNRAYFDPEQIIRRHLDQTEVYFVALDAAGEIEAVTAVQGLPQQPATLRVFYSVARFDTAGGFEDRVGMHMARLFGLLQVTSLSAKIRFQWGTAENPRWTRHERFDGVLAELGFRRSFLLANELGEGDSLVAYDRALF